MNKKTIVLGALTGLATIATPIAAFFACSSTTKDYLNKIEIKINDRNNLGMKTNFKLLLNKQDNPNVNALMKKVNGKWVFKKTDDILDKALKDLKKITLNITLSNNIKEKIKQIYNINKNNKKNTIHLEFKSFNDNLDKEFFRDLTTSNKEAELLTNKLNFLEKSLHFKLAFNLVLPKWMETEFKNTTWDIYFDSSYNPSSNGRGYFVEQIEQVSLEKNTNLKIDSLIINLRLTNFNITNVLKGLKRLNLEYNNLTSFDFSTLPSELEIIRLNNNKLIQLNTSKFPKGLKELHLEYNNLTSFDFSTLPSELEIIRLNNNKLIQLNTSKFPKGLKELNLELNNLKSFDPINLPDGLNKFGLNLNNNKLASFDPTHLPKGLIGLNLNCNKLKSFDLEKLPSWLNFLYLEENQLTSFDFSKLSDKLSDVRLSNNNLELLNTSKFPKELKSLDLSFNKLTSFDPTNLPDGLKEFGLILDHNELKSFDPTYLPKGLIGLNLNNNKLASFDLEKLPSWILFVNLKINKIKSFNLTNPNLEIRALFLNQNQLNQTEKDKIKKWWNNNKKNIKNLGL